MEKVASSRFFPSHATLTASDGGALFDYRIHAETVAECQTALSVPR